MFGIPDWFAILFALVFILFDFITGLIKALKNKNISSQIMREGLFHKVGFVLTIALSIFCETAIEHIELSFNMPLVIPVCTYIVLTELASILENLAEISPELKQTNILKLFENVKENKK